MSKINNKPLEHNDPKLTHKERMILRKALRQSRVRELPYNHSFFKKLHNKYDPLSEDKKHHGVDSSEIS